MKKALAFLTVVTMMCSSASLIAAPVNALEAATYQEYIEQSKGTEFPDPEAIYSEVTENDLVFHVYDEYAVLVECKDREVTDVVIPDEIEGIPVVGITDSPFGYCRNLTTITLPDTLQHFSWLNLTSTTDVSLGSVENPLPSVSKIVVSETNPYYTVSDGLLYSKDMKTLIGCPPVLGMKELKISEKTETIGDYAFIGCMGLEKAIIPSHVKHINNCAFVACVDLVSVELPESITSISGNMFCFCESLSEVTFKGKIEKIGYEAFNSCASLKDFTIPETVTYIGANAFSDSGCIENENGVHYVQNWAVGSDDDIEKAVIKDGTIGIAEMSFMASDKIELIDIPESVIYIGDLIHLRVSGCPSIINYRCSYIGEMTGVTSKTTTDIYIYNPECEIFDSEKTILAKYNITIEPTDFMSDIIEQTGDIVIHGYANSTAQAYAEKYNRKFEIIEDTAGSGDINGDGSFNVADVVMFQKWLLSGVSDMELADWKAADLCEDNQLNVFDICLMKKKLLEKGETSLKDDKSIISGITNGMTSSEVFAVIGNDYDDKFETLTNTTEYYYHVNEGEDFLVNLDGYMFVEFDAETDLLINYGYKLGLKGTLNEAIFPYSKQELKEAYDSILQSLTDWYGAGTKGNLSNLEEEYSWETENGRIWAIYGVNLWSYSEPESYEKGVNEIIISCSRK